MNKDIEAVKKLLTELDNVPQRVAPRVKVQGEKIKTTLQTYPPERPNSTYVRTGTLRRSWHRRMTIGKKSITERVYSVGAERNGKDYSVYVQKGTYEGKPHQAWMHRGRWQTDDQVATPYEDIIESIVIDEVVRLFS